MRWARFEKNGQPCYAVMEGDTVIPVRASPFEAWERQSERLQLAHVKPTVPAAPPTSHAPRRQRP